MKKILTLLVVLAVVNVATAAVWWEVAETSPGQFAVSLVADENVKTVSVAQLVSNGASFTVSPLMDTNVWSGDFTGASTAGFMDLGAYGGGYGYATGQITTQGVFTTGTLLTFNVAGTAGDVITVQNLTAFGVNSYIATETSGASQYTFDSFDAGTFTLVPEPMTMALLGLGGLFIRRRRA